MYKDWSNNRLVASASLLLLTITLLTQTASAYDKDWIKNRMTRGSALQRGFTNHFEKQVPMLTCQNKKCSGKKVPDAMILGSSPEKDMFASVNIPGFFTNQKWFTDRKITFLKYFDQSEDLDKFDGLSIEFQNVNTTQNVGTLDNQFDYITIDAESLQQI